MLYKVLSTPLQFILELAWDFDQLEVSALFYLFIYLFII